MKNTAIYPGSFDPVTYGHLDIIKRAIKIFDKVIVAVAHNSEKDPLFSVVERVELLRKATGSIKGVQIDDFHGLVVDYVKSKKARAINACLDFFRLICIRDTGQVRAATSLIAENINNRTNIHLCIIANCGKMFEN